MLYTDIHMRTWTGHKLDFKLFHRRLWSKTCSMQLVSWKKYSRRVFKRSRNSLHEQLGTPPILVGFVFAIFLVFCIVLRLCVLLPVSRNCPFLIFSSFFSDVYYPLANEVPKGYSNATVRPSVRPSHPCEHSMINILQWILTKLGTYLVLKRIWNLLIFKVIGQRSRSPGQIIFLPHNILVNTLESTSFDGFWLSLVHT